VVDFAVDVLCLILDLVICIIGLSKDIIEDILSIVNNRFSRLLNVLEDLCVGDDES
jgi:hypothetical protein